MLTTAFTLHQDQLADPEHPTRTAIPEEDGLSQRFASGVPHTLEARQHLFCEGDAATHVWRVELGHICIYRMMPDGRRQVVDFAYPGDIIGLGALEEHLDSAQAMERTIVRGLPITALTEIAGRDAKAGLKLYQAMSRELLAAREMIFTVSQRTAVERVAAFLLALTRRNARRGEDPNEIVLPMTRMDIADFLGLTIETVSRSLTKLRTEGVIDLEQCILVTVLNPEALQSMASGGAGPRSA
jgi:CRP-like cAMP-binding protein